MAICFSPPMASASSFTDALSKDYFKLSRVQYYYSHDRMAVKARAADKGKNVLPDDPAKQRKLKGAARSELRAAHARLMGALNGGFRTQNPKQASRAQSSFDCWLWAVVEKDKTCIGKCRKRFLAAMKAWSPPMAAKPKPKPKPMAKPKPAPKPEKASFIVYFDFNSAKITASANAVIARAFKWVREKGALSVTLRGHTDRAGKNAYNHKLAQRRTKAVTDALVRRGVRSRFIRSASLGEENPAVATADGKAEARNRRVEIRVSQ
jgi:outer membrane protein OmpA-like peptidoglycan-associated protein